MKVAITSILVGVILTWNSAVRAGDWYRWRGPEQNGSSRETGLVSTWSPEGQNLLWKAPVGGMSSPIVMNGKVYTFSRSGEVTQSDNLIPGPQTQETLVCLDAKTGKPIWEHAERMTQTEVPFWRMGWSNPVGDPATNRVYALGAQCTLLCLDANDGQVVWRRQMTEEFGMISTFGGRTPSPAVDENQVFIDGVAFGWGENAGAQHRLFAFDKNTGQLNWTNGTGGIPTDAPQNTPVFSVIDNTRVVLFAAGDGNVACFQTHTGKRLWTFKASKRGLNSTVLIDANRFYICGSEDNIDTNVMGRVACVQFSDHDAKELWRIDGIEAGFPSPTMHGDRLYVLDNKAICYAIDKNSGRKIWEKHCGTIGKASLVWADGKLLVSEANGRFWILEDEGDHPKVLSKVELTEKLGREYVIYGTPAVADGCIFLQAATQLYCLGDGKRPASADAPKPQPQETPAPGALAQIVVTPADIVLRPGQKVQFAAMGYDAQGRLIGPQHATWSIEKLTLPARPTSNPLLKPTTQKAAAAMPVPAYAQLLGTRTNGDHRVIFTAVPLGSDVEHGPTAPPPPVAAMAAAPQQIGNLLGEVDASGVFTAAAGPFQGGGVYARVGSVAGFTRMRVLPPLPWKFDFEDMPVGVPPLTWIGTGGKFAVRQLDENGRPNRVLAKLTAIPLYDRARTNFGTPDMTNYTVRADLMSDEIVIPPPEGAGQEIKPIHELPDMGIINSRYVLVLNGSNQQLQIHVWGQALPQSINKTIGFTWTAHRWYRLKLKVSQRPKTSLVQGKIWDASEKEPEKWTVELEDPLPLRSGNPGLYAFSYAEIESYYDNILVTENQP